MKFGADFNYMKHIVAIVMVIVSLGLLAASSYANNLTVANVSLGSRDPGTKNLIITFDVSWQNSWRNKINHDAVWLTVRLNNTQTTPVTKQLCQVSVAGLNPVGTSTGNLGNLELYVPNDKTG